MASGMQRHLAPTTLVPAPMGLCSCSSSRMHKPSRGPAPLGPSTWQKWESAAGFCREMVAKTTPWCAMVPLAVGYNNCRCFSACVPPLGRCIWCKPAYSTWTLIGPEHCCSLWLWVWGKGWGTLHKQSFNKRKAFWKPRLGISLKCCVLQGGYKHGHKKRSQCLVLQFKIAVGKTIYCNK